MKPERVYDYLVIARQRVFGWVRPLNAEQYARSFPIGPGSLSRTLTHVMVSEWYYVQRILGRTEPVLTFPFKEEEPPAFAELERVWSEQAERTRGAIRGVTDWDGELEYRVDGEEGLRIVNVSRTDIFTQLALHEVHHRAQVLNMLRHLGVTVGDVDFNAFMYRIRAVQ